MVQLCVRCMDAWAPSGERFCHICQFLDGDKVKAQIEAGNNNRYRKSVI